MKAADTVWVAAALLQRERGPDADMSVAEIVEKASQLNGVSRATLQTMASQHLVATAKPSPDRYRMLTAVGRGRRRLYRSGDPYDVARASGPTHPDAESLEDEFQDLVGWYEGAFTDGAAPVDRWAAMEALVAYARASGIWKGVDADEYVAELRSGWD